MCDFPDMARLGLVGMTVTEESLESEKGIQVGDLFDSGLLDSH